MGHRKDRTGLGKANLNRLHALESTITEEIINYAQAHTACAKAGAAFGAAILEIRDNRLYRAGGFASFGDYCKRRWGFSRQRAQQLINFSQVSTTVDAATGHPPANERQARRMRARSRTASATTSETSAVGPVGDFETQAVKDAITQVRDAMGGLKSVRGVPDYMMRDVQRRLREVAETLESWLTLAGDETGLAAAQVVDLDSVREARLVELDEFDEAFADETAEATEQLVPADAR